MIEKIHMGGSWYRIVKDNTDVTIQTYEEIYGRKPPLHLVEEPMASVVFNHLKNQEATQ